MTISASGRLTDDLCRIAAAARPTGARIRIVRIAGRTVEDLCRIAAAGGGCVSFGDAVADD